MTNYNINKTTTLCYVFRANQVLLILKKKGLGKGLLNGIGGMVDLFELDSQPWGPTPHQAAIREVEEEVGILVCGLKCMGFLEFVFPKEAAENNQRVYIFTTNRFMGVPKTTEEASPRWVPAHEIPYKEMWDDDRYWLPDVLRGTVVHKRFFFDELGKVKEQEELTIDEIKRRCKEREG